MIPDLAIAVVWWRKLPYLVDHPCISQNEIPLGGKWGHRWGARFHGLYLVK